MSYEYDEESPSPPAPSASPPPPKPGRGFLLAGALPSIVVLAAILSTSCAGSGSMGSTASSTSSRGYPVPPPSSSSSKPQSDTDRYYDLLQQWAQRDGYAVGDRDEMIKYGNNACVEMARDQSLGIIGAGAKLMDKYMLPEKQAGAIAVAADEVLCLKQSRTSTTATPSPTVKSERGPLSSTDSPLLGISMPPESQGTHNTNDLDKNGIPNRFENWEVPLNYDATVGLLKLMLKPYGGPLDGIPWQEGDSTGSAAAENRSVEWWWGRDNKPLILVRIEETDNSDGVFVKGVRTDVWIERRD